jgi:hypothetical protein
VQGFHADSKASHFFAVTARLKSCSDKKKNLWGTRDFVAELDFKIEPRLRLSTGTPRSYLICGL